MANVSASETRPLVPGRSCGTCHVCCISLAIDDPALQKPQGCRCDNLTAGGTCAIYQRRPRTCADYFCGFRRLDWVRDTLRPDLSGVLIGGLFEAPASDPNRRMGLMITLLTEVATDADGLAETIADAVAAHLAVWLHVPGPPDGTDYIARMNDVLRGPVRRGDMAAIRSALAQTRAMALGGAVDVMSSEQPGGA